MGWKGKGPPDRRQALFGGRGEVRVWSLLDHPAAPFDCVLGCELSPSGSVGPHVQERCHEVLLVTEGRGEAWVANVRTLLRPGTALQVPLGDSLRLRNPSRSVPLRYLLIKAPAGSGEAA